MLITDSILLDHLSWLRRILPCLLVPLVRLSQFVPVDDVLHLAKGQRPQVRIDFALLLHLVEHPGEGVPLFDVPRGLPIGLEAQQTWLEVVGSRHPLERSRVAQKLPRRTLPHLVKEPIDWLVQRLVLLD